MQFLDPNDSIVLLCDVQTMFENLIPGYEKILFAIELLLKSANVFEVPIITTEQAPRIFGKTDPRLKTSLPEDSPLVEKTQFSMLVSEVRNLLKQTSRKTVILVGLEAHLCILQTCLDLLDKGYTVHLACDAIGGQRSIDRETALQRLFMAGAILSTAETVVFQWLRDAKNPKFRKGVQPAIKIFSSTMKSKL